MKRIYEATIIVPNEKKVNAPLYFKRLKPGEHHIDKEYAFAEKYGIDVSINISDKLTPNFILASNGHIVFEIAEDDKRAVGYLPEVITERQRKIMNRLRIKWLLYKYEYEGYLACFVMNPNLKMSTNTSDVVGYDSLYQFLDKSVEEKEGFGLRKSLYTQYSKKR